jgi:hypothetical protein
VEDVVAVLGLGLADHRGRESISRIVQHALLESKQVKGRYKSPCEPVDLRLPCCRK